MSESDDGSDCDRGRDKELAIEDEYAIVKKILRPPKEPLKTSISLTLGVVTS